MIAFAMAAMMLLQSPQQFDLVCAGTLVIVTPGIDTSSEEYHARYRLDLDRRIWCLDRCPAIQRVTNVSRTHLDLELYIPELGALPIRIDRITGQLAAVGSFGDSGANISATCEPAPYTEIPQARF